ncbi:ComF family protein [Sunxiuqinia sp. sy24]|uniref:ComF family protein n=1 Tax=Sunxiuqinia sp. sy24 TaxID=3461495 RepID=UPI00404615C9
MSNISNYVHAFLELFYPRLCLVCGEKLITMEKYLCLKCLLHLPRTNFHDEPENAMEQLFYGRVPIQRATAYFDFKKGSPYQKILHQLKYRGMKELGEYMGAQYALELQNSEFIGAVDLICPVPLHPKKERKRGYNQSYHLAKGLSDKLGIPIEREALIRRKFSSTQTKKGRYERWENVEDIFELHQPEAFAGKHVLLIDDVVTTGATLEACAATILQNCPAKISILTLAIA